VPRKLRGLPTAVAAASYVIHLCALLAVAKVGLHIPPILIAIVLPIGGGLSWIMSGSSLLAVASWAIPLAVMLWVGLESTDRLLGFAFLVIGWLWWCALMMSERAIRLWYRLVRRN
jgi:hypothetical protein